MPAYRSSTRAALASKSGSADRDPGPVLPRLEGVGGQPAAHRSTPRPLTWQRMPSSRAISGQLHRDSGTSCSAGSAHASATTSARTDRAMNRWPATARAVAQAREPLDGEPAPPGPHGVHARRCGTAAIAAFVHAVRRRPARSGPAAGRGTRCDPRPPGRPAPGPRPRTGQPVRARHRHLIFVSHPSAERSWRDTPRHTAAEGRCSVVAKYPDSTKSSLEHRLHARARERWPQLTSVDVRHRGNFSYIDGVLPDGTATAAVPAALRRLRPPMGLRDLPGQPRRLRRLRPPHRPARRHLRRRPRPRLRPLPRRPHRLDLTPEELTGATHEHLEDLDLLPGALRAAQPVRRAVRRLAVRAAGRYRGCGPAPPAAPRYRGRDRPVVDLLLSRRVPSGRPTTPGRCRSILHRTSSRHPASITVAPLSAACDDR